jgi:hypothetical protein
VAGIVGVSVGLSAVLARASMPSGTARGEPRSLEPGLGRVGHDAGTAAPAEHARPADALPDRVTSIVIGGGPAPDGNEVEIEDSVRLAHELLGDESVVLFAGGPDTRSVQVRDTEVSGDPLLATLADLFQPRNGRDARYRPTTLPTVHGPAQHEVLVQHLGRALESPETAPLNLVLIGHGSGGETPLDSLYLYWGGGALEAITLSDLLDQPSVRPVRVIATSCYGGGLAEIAFAGADPSRGPRETDRCGLFATAWDLEAAGCDADPERGSRDGYALHFFEALRGHDRDGADLPEIDLDRDGVITLLEAHTRARIASRSIDVPTTTSTRLLRGIAPTEGPSVPVSLPEEEAVIAALEAVLDENGPSAVESRATDVESSIAESVYEMETLEEESDRLWTALTGALLSRWPVLDDPFHPLFAHTLEDDGLAIEAFLEASPARDALEQVTAQIGALGARVEGLELELSLIRRYLEAQETLELARHLRAAGGPAFARYERMRACENSPP